MSVGRLCIIGVGLIGGSLARAARQAGTCGEIVGCGRNPAHLERARELGVVDRWATDPAEAVRDADMVVVCVPLGAMAAVFGAIKGALSANAVVTDAGSAKASVVEAALQAFGEAPAFLVPGHPIAGTERSGVEASFAELYEGRRVILTPLEQTDPQAIARVRALWEAAGAKVSTMSVEHHDAVLAATSHLPHVLAYGLVDSLSRWDDRDEIFQYAAGGFRDFTRIASSDPVMWRDICLANRGAVVAALEHYLQDLNGLVEAIRDGDGDRLESVFRHAKGTRDRFVEMLER